MSELEDKLSAILGDPQAMGQIMSLAQSLSGGKSEPQGAGAGEGEEAAPAPVGQEGGPAGQLPDLSALLGSLSGNGESGLDPRLLTVASRVMQEYQRGDDGRVALLGALRPYVKEKRYAKLDKAIQIAKLSRLIRVALDVFRGGEHV